MGLNYLQWTLCAPLEIAILAHLVAFTEAFEFLVAHTSSTTQEASNRYLTGVVNMMAISNAGCAFSL